MLCALLLRGVGFVKIKTDCTLSDGKKNKDHESLQQPRLPGICFLRGNGVAILVALFCEETGQVFSLLVEQPRIPIGQVACLEIPAGMMDNEHESVAGIAVQEMQEECGIAIKPGDLVDLSELACADVVARCPAGISSSPGGCDEFIRYMYLEKKVTMAQLDAMRGRLQGLRDHGEYITLKVVPMADVWRVSGDAKVAV
jgi:ADP-sugar diphosphatase